MTATLRARPEAPAGHAVCFGRSGCGETKPLEEFKSLTGAGGRTRAKSICRLCDSRLTLRQRTPEQARASNLRANYGITLDDWDQLFEAQDGSCALCARPEDDCPTVVTAATRAPAARRLVVEHCHGTGNVRGLACVDCNRLLGGIDHLPADRHAALVSAHVLAYLENPPAKQLGIGQEGRGKRRNPAA